MKLIIAGGRDYKLTSHNFLKLEDILSFYWISEVVSGGATGADECGEWWAAQHNIPVKQFPADWKTHGKVAGPIRNKQMAEYADAVALFPGGRGTESMYQEAIKAGMQIFDFRGKG